MPATALRPRSATEIVDAAFQLVRRHYAQYVVIAAIAFVPLLLLRLITPPTRQFIPALLSWVFQSLAAAAIIVAVSDAYLGRAIDVGAAYRRVFSCLGSVLLAALGQGLIVAVGFLLLIIPGFIFFAWAFAMPAAVVLEGRGAADSWTRSRELSSGYVGKVLATLGLALLVYVFAIIALGAALGIALGAGRAAAIATILEGLKIFLFPIVGAVATLLYYDLRIRKEGFDIEMMAGEIGVAPPRDTDLAPSAAP